MVITEMQMHAVAQLEDRYWRAHFSMQSHYVAGRGYDQYQPAYQLGWSTALQSPNANFEDVAPLLEAQWMAHRATSLLPWREVHSAIRASWLHAQAHMQDAQPSSAELGYYVENLLRPLYRRCLLLSADLQRLAAMPVNDSLQQMIDRHVRVVQSIASGLQALGTEAPVATGWRSSWLCKIQTHWSSFKLRFTETSPWEFLLLCEQNERHLLSDYQQALGGPLPPDTKEALQQQAKQLQIHMHKLRWVRESWAIEHRA